MAGTPPLQRLVEPNLGRPLAIDQTSLFRR